MTGDRAARTMRGMAETRSTATVASGRGRSAGLTAGVDLGGTKIQVVVTRAKRVVGSARVATPQTGAEDVAAAIVATIRSALSSAGGTAKDLRDSGKSWQTASRVGLGLGVAGLLTGATMYLLGGPSAPVTPVPGPPQSAPPRTARS